MTIAQVLLQDFDTEIANTRRTLERVPENREDWAPHERSMKLGKLAMHCANLPLFGYYIMEDAEMDISNSPRKQADLGFHSRELCLRRLEETASRCRAAIANASDSHMEAIWPFRFGEQIITSEPRSKTFRQMCFNHLIHHTAQLGVYLRLHDIPVPSLYGPSADEHWLP